MRFRELEHGRSRIREELIKLIRYRYHEFVNKLIQYYCIDRQHRCHHTDRSIYTPRDANVPQCNTWLLGFTRRTPLLQQSVAGPTAANLHHTVS